MQCLINKQQCFIGFKITNRVWFLKMGICFLKWEFVYLKMGVCFLKWDLVYLNMGVWYLKMDVCLFVFFLNIGSLFIRNWESVFFKNGRIFLST